MIKRYFSTSAKFLLLIFLTLFFTIPFYAQEETPVQEANPADSLTAAEITRGERLFYGLVYMDNRSVNCASCHNANEIDTINWSPDAIEISEKYKSRTSEELSTVLMSPRSKRLTEVHNGFQLTETDIILIKSYMDKLPEIGLRPHKPAFSKLFLFFLAVGLILLALADLIILKKLSLKWIHLIVILLSAGYVTKVLVHEAIDIGRQPDYSPMQPIKFSHLIHAGQNNIDCQYCHTTVEYSKNADIPATGVCMNCHLIVRSGTRSGSFEIAKVIQSHTDGIPIEWIRVHNLPDHVYFNHSQHVGVGKIECIECHGEVENMHYVKQVSDLSMGWCVNCHREKEIAVPDNEFYKQYAGDFKRNLESENTKLTIDKVGGTECMKCHY